MPSDRPTDLPSPPDGERPDVGDGGQGGGPGGGRMGGSNVLVERFTAVAEWSDLVEQAKADLTEELFDSGYATDVLDQWVSVLTEQAGDLVDAGTVQQEADAIRTNVT
jgi:spore coat protein CotH